MNRKEYCAKIEAINSKANKAIKIAKEKKILLSNELLADYNLKLGDKIMCKIAKRYDKFIICKAYVDKDNNIILGLNFALPTNSNFRTCTAIKYVEVNQAIRENKAYDNFYIFHNSDTIIG